MTTTLAQMRTAKLLDHLTDELTKEQERRRTAFRLKHKAEGKRKQNAMALRILPSGLAALAYRPSNKPCKGPFECIIMECDTTAISG